MDCAKLRIAKGETAPTLQVYPLIFAAGSRARRYARTT